MLETIVGVILYVLVGTVIILLKGLHSTLRPVF